MRASSMFLWRNKKKNIPELSRNSPTWQVLLADQKLYVVYTEEVRQKHMLWVLIRSASVRRF